MDVRPVYVDRLLEELKAKTKEDFSFKGFQAMAEQIDGNIEGKYLYENLHRRNEQAKKQGLAEIGLSHAKLNILMKFLGYHSFREFCEEVDSPIPETLRSCVGNYYCYVRRNAEDTVILRSPVRMTESGGKVMWELSGPGVVYRGEMQWDNGCLFVLMRAENGKEFHHVYKIGKRMKPDVLQGVFSGVSTGFDPIGGRVVLIRQEVEWDFLKHAELRLLDLTRSNSPQEKNLLNYFSTYEKNNLAINKVMTYTLDDLK